MKSLSMVHARRFFALGILIALCVVLYSTLIGPIFTRYGDGVAALENDRALLQRYRSVALSAPDVEDIARSVRAKQVSSGAFVSGSTDALAAAHLQNAIGTLVSRTGGDLRSVQSLPAEDVDGLVRVRLRFQLITNIHGLQRILHELETGRPLLFVDDFKLRTRLERTSPNNDVLEVSQDFLVDMVVSGYRLGGGS